MDLGIDAPERCHRLFDRWRWRGSANRGFALLSTMMLLLLAGVMCLGLLTLSSISLKGAAQQDAQQMARANARLALQLALGELQKHAGPDQRITANAASVTNTGSGAPSCVLGVWRSWEGKDANNGVPAAPDYSSKQATGSLSDSGQTGRFLRWLVSGQNQTNAGAPPVLVPDGVRIPLLDRGTLGTGAIDAERIGVIPTAISTTPGKRGGLSWWIAGENQKARLGIRQTVASTPVEWAMTRGSHGVADAEAFGLNLPEQSKDRLTTLRCLDLAANQAGISGTKWHHLTTSAFGLLTDSARGGWRKDLSLLCERTTSDPAAPKDDSILYPWAKVRDKTQSPWLDTAAVASWGALKDFVTQYRAIKSTTAQGIPVYNSVSANGATVNYISTRMPVVGAMRFVLAYSAIPSTSTPGAYDAAFTLNPVVTVWNPWNYAIDVEELAVQLHNLPLGFTWKVGSREVAAGFNDILGATFNAQPLTLRMRGPTGGTVFRLAPGDTRVFSPASASFVDVATLGAIELRPGYRTRGGFRFRIPDLASPSPNKPALSGVPGSTFQVSIDPTRINSREFGTDLTGVYWDIRAKIAGGTMGVQTHRMDSLPSVAKKYFAPMSYGEFPSTTLLTSAASNQVFASFQIGFRTTNDCRFPARGEAQGSVTLARSELGYKGVVIWGQPNKGMFAGTQHPANSPYEYGVWAHSGWNDSLLPNVGVDERGYLVTGMAADNGINRCVMMELPIRPPASLLALRHWQLRCQNPFPPFKSEALGNSHATPLIASDSVFIPNPLMPSPDPSGMQYDDSYCMNWMLMDGYFFSSIAPQTQDWSSVTKGNLNLDEVYRRHLTQEQRLLNAQYLPVRKLRNDEVSAAVQRDLNLPTAWQTIASRLKVDGMFNVNSTSVEAWKSLLEHARDQEVVNFVPQGADASLQVVKGKGHPVSQTSVAGNDCADGTLAAYDKLSGFRRLTDEQMEALAEAIVKQIKRRGPALSLAEFYNRQLRSASGQAGDLALAGVVQAALDELAERPAGDTKNPFRELQALSKRIGPADVPNDASYLFPKAAQGWTGEGLPGWIDQADILAPLAPVLSARDDTFVVRAYGESRDSSGRVLARVWCEATVERVAAYLSPDRSLEEGDDANLSTGGFAAINRSFGRRFVVRSFRWLSPNEV